MKPAIVLLFAAMCAGQTIAKPNSTKPSGAPDLWSNSTSLSSSYATMTGVTAEVSIFNSGRKVAEFYEHDKEKLLDIFNDKGEVTFTVFVDGHVVSAGNQSVDDATKAFWKAFAAAFKSEYKEPKS
jgi:hypothetical protein